MAVHIFKTDKKAVYTFNSKAAKTRFAKKYILTQKAKERGLTLDEYLLHEDDSLYSIKRALHLAGVPYHSFKNIRDEIEIVTITRNCKLVNLSELKRILNN